MKRGNGTYVRTNLMPPWSVLLACAALASCQPLFGSSCGSRDSELDRTVTRLTASLGQDERREDAVAALVAIGPPALPALRATLRQSDDPDTRVAAMDVLEGIESDASVPVVIGALGDEDANVRLRAVEVLGTFADRRAAKPLMQLYRKDDDDQVRYECLTSLGHIGDPAAAGLLVEGVGDDDPYVRMWSADALCAMGDSRAPAVALALLEDPNRYVRQQVMQSCGSVLDTPEGQVALIRTALLAEKLKTSLIARVQLRKLLARPELSAPLKDRIRNLAKRELKSERAIRAALLLGDIKDPAAAAQLVAALRDSNFLIRNQAAYQLGSIGEADAIPALVAALDDEQPVVAATAYDSLLVFAERGNTAAREAVHEFTGKTFDQRLQR